MTRRKIIDKSAKYLWEVGIGPSDVALARLLDLAPRPRIPPGEAWFIGDKRRMFTELIELPISAVPAEILRDFLWEATTGLVSFNDALDVVENWRSWFRYLLPGLVVRSDEKPGGHFLVESIVTAFLRVYYHGLHGEHRQFRAEVLETLGKAIMMPALWDEDGESVCAQCQDWVIQGSLWPSCSGAISASLFFCLTYLEEDEIACWAESVCEIRSAYFQAHLLTWLAGAYEILCSDADSYEAIDRATININWENSWSLKEMAPVLPMSNRRLFLKAVRQVLTVERLCMWLDNISRYKELAEPLASARIAETVADVVLAGSA